MAFWFPAIRKRKLTNEQAKLIRWLYKAGVPLVELAKRYNCTSGCLSALVCKRTYRNVR